MPDSAHEPEPSPEATRPAAEGRKTLLLGIGVSVGLTLGVLLTIAVNHTYTLFTKTLDSTKDSLLVFNELNELRQQINELNEAKKLQEKDKEDAVRQALSEFTSKMKTAQATRPEDGTAAKKQDSPMKDAPARRPGDPFADIDAEIANLQQTQKVLNTILDIFSKQKEPAKNR